MGMDVTAYLVSKRELSEEQLSNIYELKLKEENKNEPWSRFYNDVAYTKDHSCITSGGLFVYAFELRKSYLYELAEEYPEEFKGCLIMDYSGTGNDDYINTLVNDNLEIKTVPSIYRYMSHADESDIDALISEVDFLTGKDLIEISEFDIGDD